MELIARPGTHATVHVPRANSAAATTVNLHGCCHIQLRLDADRYLYRHKAHINIPVRGFISFVCIAWQAGPMRDQHPKVCS